MGTRPEAIKLTPLYLELKEQGFDVMLLSTGQHSTMLDQALNFFQIKPDIFLVIERKTHSLSELTSQLFLKLDEVMINERPDLVIVQGDTTSAFVGAMCAFYNKILLAHVEAGLRTHDKSIPFPEEVNRTIIGDVADFHFAPTKQAAMNLTSLKMENIFVTGNTIVDALLLGKSQIEKNVKHYNSKFSGIVNENQRNILITGHRRESFGAGFEQICNAINEIATNYNNYNFIYPVHLNSQVREVVKSRLGNTANIYLLDPLDYDDLLFVMSNCTLILTDSGGIQEEAPSFNIPVIIMRDNTERQEGIESGCAILAGVKKESIMSTFKALMSDKDLYNKMVNSSNPYGNGTASIQIVSIIRNQILRS